jgi:hypothetical protein
MAYLMSEVVGQKGVYPFLTRIYEIGDIVRSSQINELIEETNISQNIFWELTHLGLFISTPGGFCISSLGKKVTILLKGINGDSDIYELFNELSNLYPNLRPYELITENITDYFIDSLYSRPDFIRVYICSPWIRLDENRIEKIKNAIFTASKRYPNLQISVITLPLERYRDKKAFETIKVLKQIGAEIVVNPRLHAKLYMSEPGPLGGSHYAIFGSENLTGRGNIELAIKIENDNEILRKLNQYFYEIWEESQILKEV